MAKLDDFISPGETVLWRTPTYWQIVKKPLWLPGGLLAAGVVLQLLSSEPDFFGFFFWMPLAWMAMVAVFPFGDWSEVFLTERRLVFLRHFRRPRIQMMERRDIRELEIFAGAGLMVVHGRRESLQPVCFIGESLDLAREMNLPTKVWEPYDAPKPTGRRRLVKILSWLVTPLVMLAVLPAGMMGTLLAIGAHPGWDHVRTTVPVDIVGLGLGAAMIVTMAVGVIAGESVLGGLRRLVMSRDDLMHLRCEKTDPLWRGKMPLEGPRTGLRGVIDALDKAHSRIAYGPRAACTVPEPKAIEPGAFPPPEEDGEEEEVATP